jgi:hypothetical protein
MTQNLGRLEGVPLRNVWEAEDRNFTPWLAQAENLSLLSDTLGIELELESTEKSVGPFKADILCKDTRNDTWVLIENQLERTDHTHLGQIMTYSSGLDAATIVLIAQRFTEEHRSALDWLNNITNERFRFFGLEIQAWKIGGSSIAPKFNIISQPNNWVKDVKQGARLQGTRSDTQQLQEDFWNQFKIYTEDHQTLFKLPNAPANPQNWVFIGIGKTGFGLEAIMSTARSPSNDKDELRVGLYIDGGAVDFERFADREEQISTALPNYDLAWYNPADRRVCRIYTKIDVDFNNREKWSEYFKWSVGALNDFHSYFSPLVKNYS